MQVPLQTREGDVKYSRTSHCFDRLSRGHRSRSVPHVAAAYPRLGGDRIGVMHSEPSHTDVRFWRRAVIADVLLPLTLTGPRSSILFLMDCATRIARGGLIKRLQL